MKTKGWIILFSVLAFLIGAFYIGSFLFAMKVKNDVLDGFNAVNESLEKTNQNFQTNTERIISFLQGPQRKKAELLHTQTDSVITYLENIKQGVIDSTASQSKTDFTQSGLEIKTMLLYYRNTLYKTYLDLDTANISYLLDLNDCDLGNGKTEQWEKCNFYNLPMVAVVTNISKMQSDLKNLEAELISRISASADNQNNR